MVHLPKYLFDLDAEVKQRGRRVVDGVRARQQVVGVLLELRWGVGSVGSDVAMPVACGLCLVCQPLGQSRRPGCGCAWLCVWLKQVSGARLHVHTSVAIDQHTPKKKTGDQPGNLSPPTAESARGTNRGRTGFPKGTIVQGLVAGFSGGL